MPAVHRGEPATTDNPLYTEDMPSRVRLIEILAELHALPNVLIVFNHPVWDLHKLGPERHMRCVDEFLATGNQFIHAMELNGLRSWHENREAKELAHLGRGLTSMCRLCAKTAIGGWTRAKTTPFSTPTLILRSLCRQR